MLYNKPKDVTYTQMAIWVDENSPNEDCDKEKLFEYLYHLCHIFAYKWKYFSSSKDYDDFSIFSASILFNRIEKKNLQPIKSIINYIKKILHLHKIQYQQKFFNENISKEVLKNYDTNYDVSLEYELCDKVSGLNKCEFQIYLENISKSIIGSVDKIPKKKNSYEFNNILMSCLLTYLDLITITKSDQEKLESIYRSDKIKTNLYLSLYKIPKDYKAVLYHLDQSYNDYVLFLVNKVRIEIKNDLKNILYSQVSIKDLYAEVLNNYKENDDQQEY